LKLLVNLLGAPGTGKSLMAAQLFARLKWEGYNCELATEYAKELVWHHRNETMKDELYLFAKQNHKLVMLRDKVDIVVTDRPVILSALYNEMYGDNSKEFHDLVVLEANKYPNMNLLLNRTSPYEPEGRMQSEQESNDMKRKITTLLESSNQSYIEMPTSLETIEWITTEIKEQFPQ
jgi:nicotinamide riboside kinase